MFDKYLFALGRGVRGAKKAYDEASRLPDPAAGARDITPDAPAGETQSAAPALIEANAAPRARKPLVFGPRPLVMGIVNVTPDSFSDGGAYFDPAAAIAHGLRLVEEGADILDIGGESTRPGHTPVGAAEEIARVISVIRGLAAACDLPISIDTMKADVAARALDAGASIINDVWGLQRDPAMARLAAERGAHIIVMHNREREDAGVDIVAEVYEFLQESITIALAAGAAPGKIIVDPGIGFGKTNAQSMALIRELARFEDLGCPILLGASRKRLIGIATGRAAARERVAGSLAAAIMGAERGASIARVHDVAAHVDALRVFAAITRGHMEAPR